MKSDLAIIAAVLLGMALGAMICGWVHVSGAQWRIAPWLIVWVGSLFGVFWPSGRDKLGGRGRRRPF